MDDSEPKEVAQSDVSIVLKAFRKELIKRDIVDGETIDNIDNQVLLKALSTAYRMPGSIETVVECAVNEVRKELQSAEKKDSTLI
jgi:hypothetical protein